MQRINEIASRIQAIQARVERPQLPGAFEALLQQQLADSMPGAPGPAAAETAPNLAMDAAPRRPGGATAVTLATMLGRPTALYGPGATPALFPPHQVAPGAVTTSDELAQYLTAHTVEPRNGRLEPAELVAITGSWNDNGTLLPPAASAWELMRAAAAGDGIDLKAIDAYRTWESQNRAYQAHLAGEKSANVLPPGTSRHGVGLAVDITSGHIIGRADPEWQWLENNAGSFGWFPISNEPWHWEFRGI